MSFFSYFMFLCVWKVNMVAEIPVTAMAHINKLLTLCCQKLSTQPAGERLDQSQADSPNPLHKVDFFKKSLNTIQATGPSLSDPSKIKSIKELLTKGGCSIN